MRKPTFILLLAIALGVVPTANADPVGDLDAAGERLQVATEQYNEARLRRQGLDAQLAASRGRVSAAEGKLDGAKQRLGLAVRDLYMHPGSNLGTYFQAKDAGQLQRGNALAGFASVSIDQLILDVRKAKAAESATARRLEELRDAAKHEEDVMADRQRDAEAALARTRRLLADRAVSSALAARDRSELALARETFGPSPAARPSAAKAIATAAAQIGDPYQWGAEGPDRFDCSGLTMYAWASAGVSLPHSSRAQAASLPHVPMSEIQPGDLVFRGSPIHHVGIYEGGGSVIAAPHSGANVRRGSLSSYNQSFAARP